VIYAPLNLPANQSPVLVYPLTPVSVSCPCSSSANHSPTCLRPSDHVYVPTHVSCRLQCALVTASIIVDDHVSPILQLPQTCVEYIFGNIETCDQRSPCYYPCLDYLCDFTVVFRLNMDDSLYYLTYHIPEDIWPTCRVWSENWQVRGLCRCLWYARRGLCLCPCVTTPRGFTSLPTGGEV